MRIAILVIGLVACGKGSSATAPPPSTGSSSAEPVASGSAAPTAAPATIEKVLVELERLDKATCQCADVACSDRVTRELDALRPTIDATVKATPPTTDQAERIARFEDEMRGCRRWIAAGLGSNSGGGETNAMFEIALVELERFRNQMCGCKDKACADQVASTHDAWRARTDADLGTREPNASQVERRATHEKSYAECRAKLK